jgi:hypothetical protein
VSAALQRLRTLRRWHRRIGVVAALFFLLLAISGLMLNHPDGFGLAQHKLHSSVLARWYGFKPVAPRAMYATGEHTLAWGNGTWLLDGRRVAEDAAVPIGMVQIGTQLYVATAQALFEYGPDYRLIEKIPSAALPGAPIRALGIEGDRLLLQTPDATLASHDLMQWQRTGASQARWSALQPVPSGMRAALAGALLPGISLQQLVADAHSGRLFGSSGPVLVDLLAVLLMFLALTGAWLFMRSPRRRRHHRPQVP